jgi:hypothetical protein
LRPLVSSADHHTRSGWVKMSWNHHQAPGTELSASVPKVTLRPQFPKHGPRATVVTSVVSICDRTCMDPEDGWCQTLGSPKASKWSSKAKTSSDIIRLLRLLSNLMVSFSNFSVSATGYQKCSGPVTWASCKVQFSLYPDRVSPASAVQSCVRWTLPRAFPADSRIAAHAHSSHWSSKEASTPPAVLAHRFEPSYIDNMEV